MAAPAGDAAAALCQQLRQDMHTQFGFAAQPAWLQQMVAALGQEQAGFAQQPRSMQLQLLLEQLLLADFRQAGAGGVLPPNVKVRGCCCDVQVRPADGQNTQTSSQVVAAPILLVQTLSCWRAAKHSAHCRCPCLDSPIGDCA